MAAGGCGQAGRGARSCVAAPTSPERGCVTHRNPAMVAGSAMDPHQIHLSATTPRVPVI